MEFEDLFLRKPFICLGVIGDKLNGTSTTSSTGGMTVLIHGGKDSYSSTTSLKEEK